MWKCKNCLTVSFLGLVLVTIVPSTPTRNVRKNRQATIMFVEAGTSFPPFRPQLPNISDPKCAANSTFCEYIDSYPYVHVKYLLERNASFKHIFNEENETINEELTDRQGSDASFVCLSSSETVLPKIGKNKDGDWKFIVNQDNFLQRVHVETCLRPDGPCDVIGTVSSGYSTFCRQKYIYRKLLSLNDKGLPSPDYFKLPSACCCAYKKNLNVFKHYGSPISHKNFSPKVKITS